jgi:hypothetical protein
MRTAIMAGVLMALVLGSSDADAKMACPPGSSAVAKKCRLDQLGNLCQQKGTCGTEAIGDHPLGESLSKFSPEVAEAIKEGSALAGVDPEMMAKLAYSKSGGRSPPRGRDHHMEEIAGPGRTRERAAAACRQSLPSGIMRRPRGGGLG